MGNFIAGLDLGQVQDYTALGIVERLNVAQAEQDKWTREMQQTPTLRRVPPPPERIEYHVRHLERFALGTTYPRIVSHVVALLMEPALRGCYLVVDASGVGKAVVDMFRHKNLALTAVTITGGNTASRGSGGDWTVPKVDLVAALQVPHQTRRLKVAPELKLGSVLLGEIQNFRQETTAAANEVFNAREGEHDDIVLALALACWWGETHKPLPEGWGEGWVQANQGLKRANPWRMESYRGGLTGERDKLTGELNSDE